MVIVNVLFPSQINGRGGDDGGGLKDGQQKGCHFSNNGHCPSYLEGCLRVQHKHGRLWNMHGELKADDDDNGALVARY